MSNNPSQNPGPNPAPNQAPYPNSNQTPNQAPYPNPNQTPNRAPYPNPNQTQNQAPYQNQNTAPNQAPYQNPMPNPGPASAPSQSSDPNPGPAPKKKKGGVVVIIVVILLVIVLLILGCLSVGVITSLIMLGRDKDPKPTPTPPPATEASSEPESREPKPTDPGKTDPSDRETLEDREGLPTANALDDLTLYCGDGSVLTFTGNDFSWILDPEEPEKNYYKGTYRLYRGTEADLCLTHEYKNFDITQAELDSCFKIWDDEDLRVLVLSTEEACVDGRKMSGFETPYYSFFDEKEDNRFVLINMNERVYLTFEKDTSEN